MLKNRKIDCLIFGKKHLKGEDSERFNNIKQKTNNKKQNNEEVRYAPFARSLCHPGRDP